MAWQLWAYLGAGFIVCGLGFTRLWRLIASLAWHYLPPSAQLPASAAYCQLRLRHAAAIGAFWAALALAGLPAPAGLLLSPPLLLAPTLALIDAESHKLPDSLTSFLWVSQSALVLTATSPHLGKLGLPSGRAGIAAAAWLLIVVTGTVAALLPAGLGLGDVKLAAPIGATLAALSLELAWAWLALATVVAASWAAIGLLAGRYRWRQAIAFGPPLLLSLGLLAGALASWPG